MPPQPVVMSIFALVLCGLAAWKIVKILPEVRQVVLGRDGERTVGECLAELRGEGYHVFHDILGDGFNIDHVLVGSGGVFVVETKTISKPKRGDARVVYDGQGVTVDGYVPDRDPIVQVKAAAGEIRRLVAAETGLKITPRPVVLYPGWFVDKQPRGVDVWVLNETVFPKWVSNEKQRLQDTEVHAIKAAIARRSRRGEAD